MPLDKVLYTCGFQKPAQQFAGLDFSFLH
jgi:hypothetical protein